MIHQDSARLCQDNTRLHQDSTRLCQDSTRLHQDSIRLRKDLRPTTLRAHQATSRRVHNVLWPVSSTSTLRNNWSVLRQRYVMTGTYDAMTGQYYVNAVVTGPYCVRRQIHSTSKDGPGSNSTSSVRLVPEGLQQFAVGKVGISDSDTCCWR